MKINSLIDNNMKYFYLPILNSVLIFMVFMYIMISKNINTDALEKCEKLEQQIANQEKIINFLINADRTNSNKNDTIIVNVNEKFNIKIKLEQ